MRFLYIKLHRELFRDELLAELLPPLEPDGTSHLWNAVGRKFTDMTYAEADRLSKKNKEFIKGLFPEGAIYATLLPQDAQDVIGKVGAQTKGVEKMLRRIGFRYAWRVDPFDGGPHFTAPTDEVTPRAAHARGARHEAARPGRRAEDARARRSRDERAAVLPVRVRAVARGRRAGAEIAREAAEHLGLAEGAKAWVLPLE